MNRADDAARGQPPARRGIAALPSALEREEELRERLAGKRPAVFLDYDGTLTPIVADPDNATLPPGTGEAIRRLAELCTVALVSGRDLDDVRRLVGIRGLIYAGSHGFDMLFPDGRRERRGEQFLPALDRAERMLRRELSPQDAVEVERKRFALAVHYRRAPEGVASEVEDAVARVDAEEPELRRTGGKKIFELRPDVDWDKGRALLWLLDRLDAQRDDVVPIYVGDDETDEDAFTAIAGWGIGIVVAGEVDDRPTAAEYLLEDPAETSALLDLLAAILREHTDR